MKKLLPLTVLLAFTVHGYALADGTEPNDPLPGKKADSKEKDKDKKDKDSDKSTHAKGDSDLDDVDKDLEKMGMSFGDGRIKLLMYDETDVYTITTRYGYQTNLVFGVGEEIETISVGDRSMWQIIPSGNRLFIRPMQEDVTTNMTILTNRHSYQFDLKSLAEGKTKGNIYVAKFKYPDDDRPKHPPMMMAAPPPAMMAPPPPPETPPSPMPPAPSAYMPPPPAMTIQAYTPPPVVQDNAPTPLTNAKVMPEPVTMYPNYNYTYSGPDDMAPVKVYDDGKSTYIKYKDANQPSPNVFSVDGSGNEKPVTYNMKNDMMVVDAVVPEIALKGSSGTVHVYNEMLNPR